MSDVVKHFLAGAVISSVVTVVVLLILGTDKTASDWALGLAFASALLAGVGKEWWDKNHGGFVEAADVTATWMGAVVPMVIWGIIQNYV
jgi:hypothetical protein